MGGAGFENKKMLKLIAFVKLQVVGERCVAVFYAASHCKKLSRIPFSL